MINPGMSYEEFVQGKLPACFAAMEGEIVEYDKDKNELTCTFPVKAEYLNPMQGMQGGFIAAALDNVFGPLSLIIGGKPSVTVQMQVTYHRPVHLGEKLIITAQALRKGHKMIYMEAHAYNDTGGMVASSNSSWMFM